MKYYPCGKVGRVGNFFIKFAAVILIFSFAFPLGMLLAAEEGVVGINQINVSSAAQGSVGTPTIETFPTFTIGDSPRSEPNGGNSSGGGSGGNGGGGEDVLPGTPTIKRNPGGPEQIPPGVSAAPENKSDDRKERQEPSRPQQELLDTPDPFSDILLQVKNNDQKRVTPDVDNVTGTLKYKYVLDIPPGRNNLTPEVSLTYSSDETTADSYVGSGWSLSIPSIQKVNKTGSQNLYSEDYYTSSLSGELVKVNSTTYKTKIENGDFLQYTKNSSGWVVTDKMGTQYQFGSTSQAQQFDATTTTHIYKWMLEEIRDTNNNFISYEYTKDAGQIYPSKITYTGHNSTPGIFEISFVKEPKTGREIPARTLNSAGFPVKTGYRITAINVKVNGELTRSYAMGYSVIDNWAGILLNNITEAGRDNGATTTLPVIDFNYELATPNWTYDPAFAFPIPMSDSDGKDRGVRLGDINGDGLTDIVCYNSDLQTCVGVEHPYANINNGSGWTSELGWNTYGGFVATIGGQRKDLGLRLVDVNGDGRSDLVKGLGSTKNVYIQATSSSWTLDPSWTLPLAFVTDSYIDTGLRIDDINGDGLPDLVCGSDSGSGCGHATYINNGNGWDGGGSNFQLPIKHDIGSGQQESFVNNNNLDRGLRLVDLNGDGLADLVKGGSKYDYDRFVYMNTGSGWQYDSSWNISQPFIDGSKDIGMRMADVNADGLIDIICTDDAPGQTCSHDATPTDLGSGTGFYPASSWVTPPQIESTSTPEYLADSSNAIGDRWMRYIDVNGDGLVDMVRAHGDSSLVTYMHNGNKLGNYLSQILYPQGASTTISYDMTTQLRDGSDDLLNPFLPFPRYVVTNTTTDDGFGATTSRSYSYEGGYYYATSSIAERRFAGFGIVSETDGAGNVTKTYYHQGTTTSTSIGEYDDHISKAGKPFRVEQYDSDDNLFSKTINKWDRVDLGDGASFVKLVQSVESSYDGDNDHRDKAESYTYNNSNGNISEKTSYGEVTGSDNGTFVDSGTDVFFTAMTYATSSGGSILLPSREKVTDYASSTVRDSKMYYDTLSFGSITNGNLTKQEQLKSGSTYIDIEKTYNSYGLITLEKDPRDKETSYAYDSFNLYPATTTNPLGYITTAAYEYSLGKPKQVKDYNGNVFQVIYDGLDRVVEEKQPATSTPNTLVTRATYAYTDNTFPTNVLKTEYLTSSASVPTYIYFDGLGRKVQERRRLETSNTYSVRDTTYNDVGLKEKESIPYSSTGTSRTSATTNDALWNRFDYDAVDRVRSIRSVVGTTTNAYDNWKLTVTDANSDTKDLYKDARGNLTQVDEKNGGNTYTTYYEWDGNNNLTKITDAMGNVRNFTYDNLGRRIKAEDLHASADTTFASSTFTYDDAGNMTSMTNGAGQTINYTYDDINRVLSEDFTGAAGTEVTYAYDSCSNGVGQLCFATSTATTTVVSAYSYDTLGRKNSETKTIGSASYTTSYGYDHLGNPTLITNPDGGQTSYEYNSAGLAEKIAYKPAGSGSFTDVVDDIDYSPEGKITYILNSNGIETVNTYDPDHLYRLTDRLTEGPIGGVSSTIQDLHYTYDNIGNITQISDTSGGVNDKTILYTYDDLSRLTSASTTAVASGSGYKELYTYDPIGNILTKGNSITTYNYTGTTTGSYANPHAVTLLRTTAIGYDRNGNLLTYGGTATSTYDYTNHLVAHKTSFLGATTTTYAYDHTGARTTYSSNGTATTTYPSKTWNTTGGATTTHIFLNDLMIATVTGTSTIHYHHTDHLSGSNISTDQDGLTSEFTDYYPYGAQRVNQTYDGFKEQRKFTGHEYDGDTNFTYAGARYYDGSIARFRSQDPMFKEIGGNLKPYGKTLLEILSNPQSLNSYSYALNNPLRFVDPTGETWQEGLQNSVAATLDFIQNTVIGTTNAAFHPVQTIQNLPNIPSQLAVQAKQIGADIASGDDARGSYALTSGLLLFASFVAPETRAAKIESVPRFIAGAVIDDWGTIYRGTVDLKPTLDRIAAGERLPYRRDGSTFFNREGFLPKQAAGYYKEYVIPTVGIINRQGPQRLIMGQGGEVYYSSNHYQTPMKYIGKFTK